jgi:hypothetical protein
LRSESWCCKPGVSCGGSGIYGGHIHANDQFFFTWCPKPHDQPSEYTYVGCYGCEKYRTKSCCSCCCLALMTCNNPCSAILATMAIKDASKRNGVFVRGKKIGEVGPELQKMILDFGMYWEPDQIARRKTVVL